VVGDAGNGGDRQADVDGVPVEDPRERLRDDGADAAIFQRHRRGLPGGAEPEVRPRDDDVAVLDPVGKRLVVAHQDVVAEFVVGDGREVLAGDDLVGVDVVWQHVGATAPAHQASTSAGGVMAP
jgi:hypothetical protein